MFIIFFRIIFQRVIRGHMWYKKKAESEINENEYLYGEIKDSFIRMRVQSCLEWHIRKAQKNKFYFYMLSMITIICPIISGIINLVVPEGIFRIISSIMMGGSSIAAAFLTLLDANRKWGLYRNQAEWIKRMVSIYIVSGQKDEGVFINQLEDFMGETHERWMDTFAIEKNAPEI